MVAPMPPDEDFLRLMQAWQAGSADAIAELFVRYSDAIRLAVRRRLHDRLRSKFDSLDFVQDVWASVVALPVERYEFHSPEALVGFLMRVATNKVIEVSHRQFRRQRRDIAREEFLPAGSDEGHAALFDQAPTPSQCVMGEERWAKILREFPEGYRAILARLRDGYSHEEIAQMSGVCVRTVERIIHRLKQLCDS